MRKRTIVIIISFISAFVLMSGGYGFWQKPLIITGNIEILEPPPPPKVDVVPTDSEILDSDQIVEINPVGPNNLEENAGIVPDGQNGNVEENAKDKVAVEIEPIIVAETSKDSKDTDSASIDQAIKVKDKNNESIDNPDHEQSVREAAKGEGAEVNSIPMAKTNETNNKKRIDSMTEMIGDEGVNAVKVQSGN